MPDFWAGAVPEAGGDGRGAGDVHGAQHWRAVPVLPAAARYGTHTDIALAIAGELAGVGAIAARVADGHRAVRDCDHELDWFGAHYQRVRVGCAGRLHHCDPHFD